MGFYFTVVGIGCADDEILKLPPPPPPPNQDPESITV